MVPRRSRGRGGSTHLAVRPPGDAVLATSLLQDGDAQTELRWRGGGRGETRVRLPSRRPRAGGSRNRTAAVGRLSSARRVAGEKRAVGGAYLVRDVVDGQVEVGAQHLEGEALRLASAAFLRSGARGASASRASARARGGGEGASRARRKSFRQRRFSRRAVLVSPVGDGEKRERGSRPSSRACVGVERSRARSIARTRPRLALDADPIGARARARRVRACRVAHLGHVPDPRSSSPPRNGEARPIPFLRLSRLPSPWRGRSRAMRRGFPNGRGRRDDRSSVASRVVEVRPRARREAQCPARGVCAFLSLPARRVLMRIARRARASTAHLVSRSRPRFSSDGSLQPSRDRERGVPGPSGLIEWASSLEKTPAPAIAPRSRCACAARMSPRRESQ